MQDASELCRRYGSSARARLWGADLRETGARSHTTAHSLALQAMAVEFPAVHGHPNRLPFEGVLTLVDVASDRAPTGARGHRVILSRAAAEAALPSLLGMAVDYKSPQPAKLPGDPGSPGWDGHDARQKCGIITSAELQGQRLTVAGFLFSRDFPEIEQQLMQSCHPERSANSTQSCHPERSASSTQNCHPERAQRVEGPVLSLSKEPAGGSVQPFRDTQMGMSYELAEAHVADMRASIWTLTRATFTGAAILLRDKAAYRNTSFRLQQVSRSASRQVSATAARSPATGM